MDAPPVQYATTSDGYSIAYTVCGKGPPLVLMPEPFSHLHLMWASPLYRSLYEPLTERYRLIQFDSRGFGMSGRGLRSGHGMYDRCLDLEAVAEKLQLERFFIYGSYFMGNVAARYAVTSPDRVRAIVLWNISLEPAPELGVIIRELRQTSWDLFLETMARTFFAYENSRDAIARMRAACNPADSEDESTPASETRDMLGALTMPALVVGRRTGILGLEAQAIATAALIPDARLVLFDDIAGGRYTTDGSVPPLVNAMNDFFDLIPAEEAPWPAVPDVVLAADGLSQREVEVLRLIAAGRSNAQIAEALVISPNTVGRHVSNIFDKVGAANRAEATAYAMRNGLA